MLEMLCKSMGFALALVATTAHAHTEYYDLNQGRQIGGLTAAGKALRGNDLPLSDPQYWTSTYQKTISTSETWTDLGGDYTTGSWSRSVKVVNLDSSGWTDGLRNDPNGGAFKLGDTHKVNFANFTLAEDAFVNIHFADEFAGQGFGINPSFSLYRGAIVYLAHDDIPVDPLNPRQATAPFAKVQNTKDTGSVVDSQGIISPFRDTVGGSGQFYGQFDALGSFSAGNQAGDWSAAEFVTAVTGYVNPDGSWNGNANSNSLDNYFLPAGDYIIAFSGHAQPASYAAQRSADVTSFGVVSGLVGTLSFSASVTPVPEPSTWATLTVGLVLVGVMVRRRLNA